MKIGKKSGLMVAAALAVGLVFSGLSLARAQEPAKPVEPAKPADAPKPSEPAKDGEKPADAPKADAPKPAEPKKPVNYNDLLDQPIGDHVTETKDVKYREGEGADARHVLDLYMPKGKKDVPVIVFVHGGMWTMFDKRHGKAVARGVSLSEYGVVSINYRLASFMGDKARHPDFVEDGAAAVAWVYKNIAKHGGDPKKIFLSGHSAGGHIAGLVAYDPQFLAKHDLKNTEVVRGFIGISGAYDIPSADDPDPTIAGMANMVGYAFEADAEARKKASPSNHADAGDPPALLLYAETEMFKLDMSTASMDAKLSAAKVARAKRMIAARTHQSILGEFGTDGDDANKETVAFVKAVLAGEFKGDPEVLVTVGAEGENGTAKENGAAKENGNGGAKTSEPASSDKPADKPVEKPTDKPVGASAGAAK